MASHGGGGGGGWQGGGGNWHGGGSGGGNWHGGGSYHGGYYGHGGYYYGHGGYWGPGWGLYFGAPWLAAAWGYPYYPYYPYGYGYGYGTGYGSSTVIYDDQSPAAWGPPPADGAPPSGYPQSNVIPAPNQYHQAPTQAPAQFQYFCPDSGYYPAVRTCPRGWVQQQSRANAPAS